ncbi:MAG: acyltransferase [Bacteroidetes bacterium]|nr:acyltransferase [Bacteroidota bacterium]
MHKVILKLIFENDLKANHFKALDGLRGIAILFVLLSHSSNASVFIHKNLNFQGIGNMGVYLFFVLSAYLLDRQIAIAFITKKSSKQYWMNYILRRFLRIYPLFAIALISYGILTYYGHKTVIDKLIDVPLHLALVRGEGVFWSIPVELKYYIISPLIMLICHKYLKWYSKKVIYFFLSVIFVLIMIESIFNLPNISTLKYIPIFLTGTFFSVIELLHKKSFKQKKFSKIIEIVGLISIGLILIVTFGFFKHTFSGYFNFRNSVFYLPFAIFWVVILIASKYGLGIIKHFLEIKWIRFLGTISFSVYLIHKPILFAVNNEHFGISSNLKIYVFFIVTILLSTLSFLLIEKPLSKIRIGYQE